ncbi:winged helix-turn-helix domain-containing protein, partial [Pectobacterium brasiliense]
YGMLAAIQKAGPEGLTDRELAAALGTSRAAVRLHTRALLRDGHLERCREGTTLDPYVYRAQAYQGQPAPAQRLVVITGRPRKTPLPQAAD